MKKTRFLIVLLGAVLCAGLLSFAACKPEEPEKQTATLTLSAGEGGSLPQTSYEVEVGASLADYLKNIVPLAEEGLDFAGWYNGTTLLAAETMPQGGITLTAKYNASYTVSVRFEDLEGEYGEAQTVTGKAIYGEPFTYEPSEEHFVIDAEQENRLSTQKLGKGETFTAYLKRETFGIHYYINPPEELGDATFEGDIPSASVRYGAEISLAGGDAFTVSEWFRFAGWATEADGELVYRAGEEVSPESDLFLYAVWDKAYFDRFGGADFLFFPQTEPGTAVLLRAGEEYRGTCNGDAFSFKKGEEEILKGKVNANGTFIYYHEALEGAVYLHADAYKDVLHEDGATLTFNGYGEATYTESSSEQKGEVSYDPDGMVYEFKGSGNTFSFILTELTDGPDSERVFVTVGAEEGIYLSYSFFYQEGEAQIYPSYGYFFDGIGNVIVFDASTLGDMVIFDLSSLDLYFIGSYSIGENAVMELDLIDAEGQSRHMGGKLLQYGEQVIYIASDGFGGTYEAENGDTLALDGFSGTNESAVWTSSDTVKKGMYVLDYSPLGTLLRFLGTDGKVTTFRLDGRNQTFETLGGEDYTEYLIYYGVAGESELGSATLVLGDGTAATLYVNGSTYAGTFTSVEGKEDFFRFTSSDKSIDFEFELGKDTFLLDDAMYYCGYFKCYPVEDEDTRLLHEKNGADTLLLTEDGDAVYTSEGESILGMYIRLDAASGTSYVEFLDIEAGEYYYFEISGNQFTLLGFPSGGYLLYQNGEINEDVVLYLFDSGAEKFALYFDDDGNVHEGEFDYDDFTAEGTFTYSGTDAAHSAMKFVLVEGGLFSRHNGLWEDSEKTFTNGAHFIELDSYGFGFYDGASAEYVLVGPLSEANKYRIYLYAVLEDGLKSGYFDIDLAHGTYTACGYEVGQYYEDGKKEDVLYLDGYGNVTRYNIHEMEEDGETMKPLEKGKYEFVGNVEEEIVRVTFGTKSYLIQLYMTYDGEEATLFYTAEFEGAGTYVSDKWEYLTLDSFGNGVYTDEYGINYEGEYTLISENGVSFTATADDRTMIFVLGENDTFIHPTSGSVVDGDTLVKYLGGDGTQIRIPDGVKKIAPLAFSEHVYGSAYLGADIVSVDLNAVEEIGENAFNGCTLLKSVTGKKLKKVGENAFYACIELSSLDLPALEEIGEMAFHLCESLEKVELPAAKTVYSSSFSGCSALTEIVLPAAEKLYEGVFYDCFALKLVTLGGNLTQLGTPEESVAGVFERSYAPEQSPLKVKLLGTGVPTVGRDLFLGVTAYTVVVPDIQTVKQFYLADGWAAYNSYVGCESDYDGTYYNYRFGVYAFVLDGILREIGGSSADLGAYEVRNGSLYTFKFDPSAEGKCQEAATPLFKFNDAGNIVYDPYNYGDEAYAYIYFKAGRELTVTLDYTEDTIVFTPAPITVYLSGIVYEVPAVWTKDGVAKEATVQLSYDKSFAATVYLKADGNRYMINSLYTDSGKVSASLGNEEFDPLIRSYTAEDESLLTVSQNDKDGTNYTVSFILAAIKDEDGTPFVSAEPVPVEKSADGNTFTAKQSYVFAGYSYKLTFTLTGEDTFSYSYVRERQIVVESADKSAKVVLYQAASGEITSVTLFVSYYGDDKEIGKDTNNFVLTHADGSNVYRWLVYEYNYAGDFTLTLTGEGDELTGTLSVGTFVKGYQDGVYVIAFYAEDALTELYMRGTDGEYGKAEETTENKGYLTVEFKGNTYYVTLDLESKTVAIVFADMTYESNSWDDIQGTVRVMKDPDGTTTGMILTVEEEEYKQYTEYQGDYSSYYIFTDGTKYYYVTLSTSNCSISALSAETFTSGDFNITLLVQSNDTVAGVASATYQGQPVEVSFEALYTGGKDYASLTFTVNGTTKNYLANITDTTMSELTEQVLETADKKYRVTVLVSGDDFVFEVTKFEESIDGEYVAHEITWQGHEQGDGYNYDLGDENYTGYRLNFENENGTWKVTLYQKY